MISILKAGGGAVANGPCVGVAVVGVMVVGDVGEVGAGVGCFVGKRVGIGVRMMSAAGGCSW